MSMGFMGIQFGFALQNSSASRILQSFGADMEQLSWFWLAAPLTGLIIQPIIGHYSDRTWTRLGRRRPFFLVGAVMAAIALVLMPNAGEFAQYIPPMFVGAGFLMIMDASINVAMEPFRALVGDMLPAEQTTRGFAIQSFLIGVGAVVGSWLPYILAEGLGISKVPVDGRIPDNVVFAFYVGAAILIITILWTVFSTKEYTPEQLKRYQENDEAKKKEPLLAGVSTSGKVHKSEHKATIEEKHRITDIWRDLLHMPTTMKQLSVVQFFTWIALFGMWVFSTPAIAQHVYGVAVDDAHSVAYQDAGNWVGIIFGVYNAIAMIYALMLPAIAKRIGRKSTHSLSLLAGGLGLISIYFIKDPNLLLLSMVGVGMAWGSILSMPYAILAPALPPAKMGVYMGIFNIFITLPQIVNGVFGGPMVKRLFDSQAIYAILLAGFFLLIASASMFFVKDNYQAQSI